MSVQCLKAITLEEYRAWFDQHFDVLRHRSPFHHPIWLEVVGHGLRFEVRVIGIYEGGELVAAVPGFLIQRGPFSLFGSPLRGAMTSYLGPVGLNLGDSSDALLDTVAACSDFARKKWGAIYTRYTLRDVPTISGPELGPNWKRQRSGSYRLDLSQGAAALWDGLKPGCRRNIRRAQREGIEIVPLDNAHLYHQMLDDTLSRHGTSVWHSERFFHLILEQLVPNDLLWPWGARYDGRIIAAGLFFHDDREMHFLSGASLSEYGSLPTSYLLHWHAIEAAVQAGLRIYNSDVSRVPSIDRFKESFRPELERRGILIWAPSYVRVAQNVFLSSFASLRRFRSWLKRA